LRLQSRASRARRDVKLRMARHPKDVSEMTDLVTIGQILKPFGVRGDVRIRLLSDLPGRFESLPTVTLETPSGRQLQTSVRRVRAVRNSYVVGFEAFCTPEEAGAFRGALIKVPRAQQTLPEGQYLECDLIGSTVNAEDGRCLGTLDEVLQTDSNAVFVVHGELGEILVPGTREVVVGVDVPNKTMTVHLVDGLIESRGRDAHAV
jgi:16S rRNA processing protein RimM